ncbi:AraC family transcriptional regulator [Arthrobacter sp. NPDC090010]|uniref:AraC family transcriptional regulator n=1 Tax=Arthrobacter sp. NPDC090010 TaxID=3363942 RepID=UPI0037F775D5
MTDIQPQWEASASFISDLSEGEVLPWASPSAWFLVLSGSVVLRWNREELALHTSAAAFLRQTARFRIQASEPSRLLHVDLAELTGAALPEPAVVPDFNARHYGVTDFVTACPLSGKPTVRDFNRGYGHLIGGAMLVSLETEEPASEWDSGVCRAATAIRQDPGHPWTLLQLSKLALLSRSALAERFRVQTGVTPMQYVRQERLARAAHLLRHGDQQISQIAASVGYTSDAAFVRAFSAELGTTPGRWRASAG